MERPEINPCPFCGATVTDAVKLGDRIVVRGCPHPMCAGWDMRVYLEKWNTRVEHKRNALAGHAGEERKP